MNFYKRAIYSIYRNKIKSLTLFLIILILVNIISTSVSIRKASDIVEKDIKSRIGNLAAITTDYDKLESEYKRVKYDNNKNPIGDLPEVGELTSEIIRNIAESKYVIKYDFSTYANLHSKTIIPWTYKDTEKEKNKDLNGYFSFVLNGVEDFNFLLFSDINMSLVDGRVFNQSDRDLKSNVIIISKELSDLNGFKVGDSILLKQLTRERIRGGKKGKGATIPKILEEEDIYFKIIGTFKDNSKYNIKNNFDYKGYYEEIEKRKNSIYTLNDISIRIGNEDIQKDYKYENINKEDLARYKTQYQAIYIINSSDNVQKFVQETNPILPKFMMVDSSVSAYKIISRPISNISNIAKYVLFFSVIASIIIISLVIMLFLRERRYEFGVYLSLGENRKEIIKQVIIEVLLISIIAIFISIFTGNIIAKTTEDFVINASNRESLNYSNNFGVYSQIRDNDLESKDVINTYTINLSFGYILRYLIITCIIITIATILPMIYIIRLNPKEIMT